MEQSETRERRYRGKLPALGNPQLTKYTGCMGNKATATVKLVEDLRLIGHADSGHGMVIDGSSEKQASSPMELVLIAIGGCTAMDVISILKKKRQDLRGLEVQVSADRADEHPRVYTSVTIHYRVAGRDLSDEAVRKSIELSEDKYCSVLAMIAKTATVKYDWEIINSD
jgi:putative redox protein